MNISDPISIIIPTYNRRNLLGITIDNILKQTLRPHEIIIVDDHSTDETTNWLKTKYGDKLIILTNKGNGPGAARNTGLEASSGQYIKFFDSDDAMTINTLEEQLKELKESGKQFVTSPFFFGNEQNERWMALGSTIVNYYARWPSKPLRDRMIAGLFLPIPSMLFKRSLLTKIGPWPEKQISSEDWGYLWELASIEPHPAHTNKCAFLYRKHPQQSTGNNITQEKRDRERFEILKNIYQKDIKNSNFSYFQKSIFKNKLYQLGLATKNQELKTELMQVAGSNQSIVWFYLRSKMKIQRYLTKSDWQLVHGPLTSGVKTQHFLSLL